MARWPLVTLVTVVASLLPACPADPTISNDAPVTQDGSGYQIRTPPQIHKPATDRMLEIFHSPSTLLEVSCEARGTGPIMYTWLQNGISFTPNDHIFYDPHNGSLRMPDGVTKREEGDFRCHANNLLGTSVSQLVRIRAKEEPEFPQRVPQTVNVKMGAGVNIRCEGKPRFVPDGFYHWYLLPRDPTSKNEQIIANRRISVDANGTLYITSARLDDQYHDKDYACAVQARDKRTIRTGGTVYLKVDGSQTGQPEYVPKLMASTGYIKGDIGGEVLLECFFEGFPLPDITWRDPRDSVITGRENRYELVAGEYNRKLRIVQLTDDDEGNFRCEAQNTMGSVSSMVFLNVTSGPIFVVRPINVIAPRGSDAMFTCLARPALKEQSLEPPMWFVNGQPIQNATLTTKYTFSADMTQLTFHTVTHGDVTCVQCNVTNERGYAFGDAYLAVIEPLEIVEQPKATMEAEHDAESVNLTVAATADSCCPLQFHWYLNNELLKPSVLAHPPYSYYHHNNTFILSISLKGTDDDVRVVGVYRCYVWHSIYHNNNNNYNKNLTVRLTVKPANDTAPTAQPLQAEPPSLWWLGIVFGVIVLIIAAIVVFLMVHYNYPRQEYLLEKEERKYQLDREKELLDQSFIEI